MITSSVYIDFIWEFILFEMLPLNLQHVTDLSGRETMVRITGMVMLVFRKWLLLLSWVFGVIASLDF